MAVTTIIASPGDDCYRLAARLYRDAMAATLLMRANNLSDPFIQAPILLIVPAYNVGRANDGILASQ